MIISCAFAKFSLFVWCVWGEDGLEVFLFGSFGAWVWLFAWLVGWLIEFDWVGFLVVLFRMRLSYYRRVVVRLIWSIGWKRNKNSTIRKSG